MDSEQITVNPVDRENKKKRVEELGSTLAKIRARVKANRGNAAKNEDEIQPSRGSKHSEDVERTALTKKLEEDRVRFSKHQSEKAKIKEAMDQIMIDREEQKKVEKQLQEAIAKVTAPAPEIPTLIKQRIIDLETSVENLKEKLYEKDKVLSSKSQALGVLHNQLMQRSQEHAERAMAITQEISTLKEDFGKREENWKKEMLRLKAREEELEQRLSEKEAHTSEVESMQLELTLIRQSLNDATNKNEDVTSKLENLNKINLKLKAQLKAVKQERDKLKESQERLEDTETLHNRIALLEEEKGNLQLQLVDFDDVKDSLISATHKANMVEEEMIKLKENLKNIMEEKDALQESFAEASKETNRQSQLIERLKISLKELEEQKISAEMRSIEIEEKYEILQSNGNKQIEQLLSEMKSLKAQFDEQNLVIASLNNQLSLKDQEIADIKGNNFPAEVETETRLKEIESYNNELMEKIRELQLKSNVHEQAAIQLNEMLSERNDTISQLQLKYDEIVTSLDDIKKVKDNLLNDNERLKAVEATLRKEKQSNEGAVTNTEDKNLAHKFKKLAASYKIKTKLCQESEEKLKNISGILEAKNQLIAQLSEREVELKAEIDSLKNKENGFSQELEDVEVKNCKLLAIIDDLTPKLEALEAERSAALINVDKMNKAFEELKEWKEGDSKLLKEHITSVNSMASHVLLLEDELGKLQMIVNEKNNVIGELETERKKLVADMKNSEEELDRLSALYQQESVKNQNVFTNLQGLENEMLVSREEMNQIAVQLDNVTKNYNACLGNLQERENYIETLEQDIVGMKSKMYNLESGIEERHRILQERGNQLSAKLEEAEILRHSYDKYQVEMEKKFQLMEENEKSLKEKVIELHTELQTLKESNLLLSKENSAYELEKSQLTAEISTLNDIRNSYNFTLDRIEVLNEELKQVMDDFESKNQELIKLSEERAELFNKLTDLEETHSDLKTKLSESEKDSSKLRGELDEKNHLHVQSQKEISELQARIGQLTTRLIVRNEPNINMETTEQPVDMFSWDQHSQHLVQKDEQDIFKFELEESKKSLDAAQKEIHTLQLTVNSILKEKDEEIYSLQEEINKLLCARSVLDLDSKCPIAKKVDKDEKDVKVFSWDQHSHEATKDEEDGWGWIGEEARLEQDHKHSEALQIQALTQKVKELEEERLSLTDKLGASKIKCLKLLKKLKETEAMNEQSKSQRDVGFGDLDFALQEELRSQLDQLEVKNKELSNELNMLKLEKDNLTKKVDVLSTAHDQLIEMKERQDIEVQMWQKKSSELKNQLQGLQWTMEELKSEMPSHGKGEDDFMAKCNILAIENEELQRVICNLKDGRPIGSPETVSELNSLKEEFKKLKEIRLKEKETFENESKKANEEIDAMESQLDVISKENQELKGKLIQTALKEDEISSLLEQIEKLNEENKKLKEQLCSLTDSKSQESELMLKSKLEEQLNAANEEIRILRALIEEKSRENDNVRLQITDMKRETESLLEKMQLLGIENSEVKEKLQLYSEKLTSSEKENGIIDDLNSQLNIARNQLITLQKNIDLLNDTNDSLQEQLQTMSGSVVSEINVHVENLQRSHETIKDLENELKFARGHINDLENYIEHFISKMQISTVSNNCVEKLKEVIVAVSCELNKKIDLEKEISSLRHEISKVREVSNEGPPEVSNASLPVFKGFFTSPNDPFDNIAQSQESVELVASKIKSDSENSKLIISKLQEEKSLYESEITHLKNRLFSYEEHFAKQNSELEKRIEEMKFKLERSEAEIHHWREQATVLNQDINNLVQRHNQEKEDLKKNEEGSKEKLLEIEENYQNTLLNKEQENIQLRQNLLEKEQQLTNSVNEVNSLQTQYAAVSQQLFSLENRLRDLIKENEELQSELDTTRREENTVIEKQKEEIQDLMAKLEYLSRSQNLQKENKDNEDFLRYQLNELSNHYKTLETSNEDFQRILSSQAEEILVLKEKIIQKDNQKAFMEELFLENQKELDRINASVEHGLETSLNSEISLEQSPLHSEVSQQHPSLHSEISQQHPPLHSEISQQHPPLHSEISQQHPPLHSEISQQHPPLHSEINNAEINKYIALIKQKDLEIERVSKVLFDTQERLVQVQDSKPTDKILSLQTKLDQALCTLHIRDVRCDELTQEIMQLLEERDTLQLRLSDSLREIDILRKGTLSNSSAPSPALKNKLGELHKGYKRDPVVQMEMESRHNEQMTLYSQQEESKEDKDTTVDYGFFNWFFSSPTSNTSQQ